MNKKIKAKWVAALRSGQYKQTHEQLRDGKNGFCCLGVLCNLHAQAHPKIAAKETDPHVYMGAVGLLPLAVRDWAGLPNTYGDYVTAKGAADRLDVLNDAGYSFKKIAKLIEAQL